MSEDPTIKKPEAEAPITSKAETPSVESKAVEPEAKPTSEATSQNESAQAVEKETPTHAKEQKVAEAPAEVKPKASDLDFVADTKAAFLENKTPYASLLLFTIIGMIGAFIFWASNSEISEITRGQGKVIPTDMLKIVQSLEGGILSELLVKEGDIVSEGQVLLKIDDTAFSATHKESMAQRDNLLASVARFDAEANNADAIQFPDYILENRQDLVTSENRLFETRRQNLESGIKHLSKSLELKQQELEITIPLADKGIVSHVELLRLQNVVNDTEGELFRIQSDYTKEVLTKRNDSKAKLDQIEQSILAYKDKVRRATVHSPTYGTINKIYFTTIGGVIRGGEPIIEIVPLDSTLLVEADIRPADIGFIHPGQEAVVKLTAYDFSIYGGLEGTVEQISADTFMNERGESFYKIRVRTGARSLKTTSEEFNIIPGMQAEVGILTGEKTILDYVFKPLLRAKMNAFTER